MDTDSEDMLIELSYLIPERNGKISLSYDIVEHNLSYDVREEKQEFFINADMDLIETLRLNAAYGYGKIKNIGAVSGNDENINTFIVQLSYEF